MSKKRTDPIQPSQAPPLADDEITIRPYWDKALRELWVGPILVKRFTKPATNQEVIFQCYQEIDWNRLLYDPLPPKADLDACERLHKAVERLNGHQRARLLRFRAAEQATAFVWQWAISPAALRALLAAENSGVPAGEPFSRG